ncbi:hypothetical protein ACVWYN_002584 [Pedobacter sp. UYP24]
MKRIFCTFIFIVFYCYGYSKQAWYVTGSGSDSNDGHSLQLAFLTLQKAADLVQPGDIVWIGNGVYTSPRTPESGHVLWIARSGTPNAWITWKALKGQHPVIRPTGWAGISISGSYQILDGLTVTGYNDSIFLLEAINDGKKPKPDPYFNSNGIFINGRDKKSDAKPHHIIIRNCEVNKCPGGGIAIIEADYVTVEDCRISENAWFMRYGGSGISTLDNWAYDDKPGYHMIIQRNYVWNNKTLVPWNVIGRLSDGNGIILDVTDQEDGPKNPNGDVAVNPDGDKQSIAASVTTKPARPIWTGRALVANNISAFNGGSGIHTFKTSHVDVINNTTYWNGQIVGYPEMFANVCHDVVFLNNIIVPRPAGKVTSNNNKGNDIRWDYNMYPVKQEVFKSANEIIADPLFLKIDPALGIGSFIPGKESKALGSGSLEISQATDITGAKRPKGGPDRGAFER